MKNSENARAVHIAAAQGASWLAVFKTASQIFSWVVTIIIARILTPDDYGLMAKATIITGYAQIFSELGLGAAIIQRKKITPDELYSIFWFSLFISTGLALSCIPAAYATAWIMKEPRVIPLTMAVGSIFILSGFQIVPLNLLQRRLNFKAIGIIEMSNTMLSCIGMLLIAYMGGGAWALLGGSIIRALNGTLILYFVSRWYPKPIFSLKKALSYIRFGLSVASGRSLFYVWQRSGTFFGGRAWSSGILGYYTLAMQLAKIPTDKIVTLINQVSYSAFSRLQDDKGAFKSFYLNLTKIIATIVLPLFISGYLLGEDLIKMLLGAKWLPSVFLFKCLCISQIFASLGAMNSFVHLSLGKPNRSLYYQVLSTALMPISFYFSVQYGLNAIVIPWITVYICISTGWTFFTLRTIEIRLTEYLGALWFPVFATGIMYGFVAMVKYWTHSMWGEDFINIRITGELMTGIITYSICNLLFNRKLVIKLVFLVKGKTI